MTENDESSHRYKFGHSPTFSDAWKKYKERSRKAIENAREETKAAISASLSEKVDVLDDTIEIALSGAAREAFLRVDNETICGICNLDKSA